MATSRRRAPTPTRAEILRFIEESPGRVGKREIARAFGIRGDQRSTLRDLLADMSAAGEIGGRRRRAIERRGGLPRVTVIEITETDVDGEVYARPIDWRGDGAPPRIVLGPGRGGPGRGGPPAPGRGDRLLARLTRREDDLYEAQAMRMVGHGPREVIGVYRRSGDQARLVPTDRRLRDEFRIAPGDGGGARAGDLVVAEVLPGRRLGPREARVRERIGNADEPGAYSLIAIHNHAIPARFGAEALAEAAAATTAGRGAREDLRELALVTIDPAEARDHDDAVWARPDPARQGGWEIIVAIADVAHHVRPGGALDAEARERGNSVYFPDRVVPMLPEALSADLCSLRRDEDRACIAVRIHLDAAGNKVGHVFVRGLMKARANLTYEAVQAAHDASAAGRGESESPGERLGAGLAHLYGAYDALRRARDRRAPLDLDLPERRIRLGSRGEVVAIETPPRLDSHRLIEEYMIAANVCAAESLERAGAPCVYRVHDRPAPEKIEALRDFLATLNYRLAKGQAPRPRHFNGILARAASTPHAHIVNEVVLRAQAQALYSVENGGHFGLGLRRYAHFTSPIRRYADLLVHRALIAALGLGEGGLGADTADRLATIAAAISAAERRGIAAEREALDRYTAAFMADKVGAEFDGRISGVARFGMFVSLPDIGADGLVPMSSLADDYYHHDPARHALVGRHRGRSYRLGDRVSVRLVEATPLTGGLRFELVGEEHEAVGAPHPGVRPR